MKKTTLIIGYAFCFFGLCTATPPTMQFWNDYAAGSTGAFCRVEFECRIANGGFKTGGVCWNTTGNPTLEDASATYQSKTGTSFLCKMTGLEPTTRYYVRPYITTITPEETYYGDAMCIYTIPAGNLTYTNNHNATDDADSTVYKRLETVGQHAQQLYHDWTSISKHVWFNYSPGTPTADANYEGWIRFGENTSYQRTGTLLHELNHVMGSGTWSGWSDLFDSSGKWKGHRANEVAWLITGDSAVYVQKSGVHFWLKNAVGDDYAIGINGAQEDHNSEFQYIFNCLVTQAFTEDGLPFNYQSMPIPGYSLKVASDTTAFYIKPNGEQYGRYTSYLRENEGKLELTEYSGQQAIADEHAAWLPEYLPAERRYIIKNAATGNYLSILTENSDILLVNRAEEEDGNSSIFQLIRTLDGTFTDSNENTSLTTQSFSIVGNPEKNMALDFNIRMQPIPIAYSAGKASQQWLFFTKEEALLFDQINGLTALPSNMSENIRICNRSGYIHISNIPHNARVECFDITGKCLLKSESGNNEIDIPVQTGLYVVCIETEQSKMARKVIIQ